jgi:hypothetical protein
LRWLARPDVAGTEPLGLALGFGRRATYSHLARLADAGLVVRAYDPRGSVVAITAAGRRAIDEPRAQVRVGATHGLGLQHARAVSWVAALPTIRDREWVSARELRRDPSWPPIAGSSVGRRHRPTVGVPVRSSLVAIEVELWRRPPSKLRSMMVGYSDAAASRELGALITVSDRADVLVALTRAATQFGLPDRRFGTRRLADVQVTSRLLRQQVVRRAGPHALRSPNPGGRQSEGWPHSLSPE